MNVRIYTTQDEGEWSSALAEMPMSFQDIYYTPGYHKAFENNNDGKAVCFVFRDQGETYLNCFMVNSVNALGYKLDREYFDIQSVYGYSGALSSSEDSTFLSAAEKVFNQYCSDHHFIAEFSRYHPVLKNIKFANKETSRFDRTTVIVDLSQGYQSNWDKHYSTNARNMVRKAQREYMAEFMYSPASTDVETFVLLYEENMIKVNAHPYYRFSPDFFRKFFHDLKDNIILFTVKDQNGVAMCSSIFLYFNKYIHYHLSGRANASNNSINSFLIDAAIKFACGNGFQTLHLGGGRTSSPEDSLLKFKKNFSPLTGDFFIAKKVLEHRVYSDVLHQWEVKFPDLSQYYQNQILRYRHVRKE